MNKSIKKIAFSLLLALVAIVVCVLGSNIFSYKSLSADAASSSVTDVVVTADKTNAEAGETITFTVTITPEQSASFSWTTISLTISPMNSSGAVSDNNKYFSLDETFGTSGIESNLLEWDDSIGDYKYTYYNNSNYQNGTAASQKGLLISFAQRDTYLLPANEVVTIKYKVKVASDTPNGVGNLSFGVAKLNANAVQYNDSTGANPVDHVAATGGINCTSATVRIGKVSSDKTLKSLSVGTTSATTAVTIADSMTHVKADAGTSFKFKAAANDAAATMKYCVGTGTPTTALTNDTETSITLDSSGETTLKILVTAEDASTKTYTLVIKSSYARLSNLAVAINRPASAASVSGMGLQGTFAQETVSYTVKVPSDNTSVDVTPTILSGYGATGVAVTANNCTSDVTTISTKASITNIKDGGTLTLTVTAKDGTTKKAYTITFSVVNVDTSIKTFTMTESTTGTTVNNDAAKATANSVDYYFLLSEESGFKGKFNMTLNAATSSATVDGTAYSSTTERSAKTYTIVVTAQGGNTKTYKVMVAKNLKPGYIANLKYQIGSSSAVDVLTDSGTAFDSASNTYTMTKEFDPATYPANTTFKLTGTASEGATVTATSISGGSGTWTKSLALGTNEFNLKANVDGVGATTYKFVIKLVEKKNSITSMTLKQGTNVISDFSFNSSQPTYSITVPYKNYDTINIEAVSDGILTTLKADVSGTTKTFTHTANTTAHTLSSVALTAGAATTIKVYGIADNGTGNKGTEYTIVITRGAADTNAKLQTLDVSVDGTPITEYDGGVTFDPDTLTYTYTIESTGNTTATIALAATAQSDKATVTGTGTKTFTFGTTSKTETYTITVTPESGAANKKEYKINIKRVVLAGDFTDIEVSTDGANFTSIFSDFDATKSQTISYNVSSVSVGTSFSVKVTLNTPDAKVGSLTGLTKNGDVYVGNLSKFGLNTFKIAATSSLGSALYTINVNLYEDKHDINNITITDSNNALLSDFTFNSWQDTYSIDLPFTTSFVMVKVTPDGKYNVICETGNKKLTQNGTVYEKKVTLTAGSTTTLVVYGVANNGTGLSSDSTATGTKFTFNFNRAAADSSTTLSQLSVKINGVEKEYKDVIVFNPNVNDYVIEIEKEGTANTATVELTAVPTVTTSTVKCDTVLMTSNSVTKTFTFQNNVEHETTYNFLVTSQSGTTNTYTVTIKRIIIPGDFTALEFAEAGSTFEDVFASSRYDEFEKTYTVDLSTDTVSEGSSIRIKATPTSGATVTASGLNSSSGIWSGKLAHGKNEFSLTAKSATGQATYKFIVNLYENKKDIERITLTSDGATLSTDLFNFSKSQTTYRFTVPYTVKTLKMAVSTDGVYTTVVDELGNTFSKTVPTGRNHERTIDLPEGRVTTLLIRGKSDKDEEGEWYTFEITRDNANADASLKALSVTVGGKPVTFTEGAFNPDVTDYNILVDEASSYTVNINATPTASTSKVTGAGTKTFNLGDSTATQTYPITVTAEDGTERTYNITISQKPIVLDSNYDLTRIVINGNKDYYDDVPAAYNDPVKITVPYSESRVKVVVTPAVVKSQVVIDPALTKSGYLDLPEGETVTLKIYAIAEDGSNSNGEDAYIFEITRLSQGEIVGPDTEIYIDDEEVTSFVLASSDTVLHVLDGYNYKKDKLKFQVDLAYGGTYEIKRISEDGIETVVVGETDTGKFKNVKLDFGTNVFSVDIVSNDGHAKKSAIFVVDRGEPTLEEISSPELPTLKNDFNKDPYSNAYSYSVGSDVDRISLDVEVDKDLFTYDVVGGEKLEYGMNDILVNIYEKGNGRAAAEPLKTITLSVYREPSNFWLIMFCVTAALALVELIIVIILLVRKNNNDGGNEPEYIYASAPAEPQTIAPPPIILQLPPQN